MDPPFGITVGNSQKFDAGHGSDDTAATHAPEISTCTEITGGCGQPMRGDDVDNPQNWPKLRKTYASLAATAFAFSVTFCLTSYPIGIPSVIKEFDVPMTLAIVPFSLYLVGIAFAPLYTPHVSERFGRAPVYFVTIPVCALFTLGASRARNIATLCICRFFAGFFGGPSLVLIEGTYADIFSPATTLLYYADLTIAGYLGAICGPIVNGYIVATEDWRWTQYTSLMIFLGVYLFAIGMPETYGREIVRRRARRAGKPHNLEPAQSGTTLLAMAKLTLVQPLAMLVSEPIVTIFTVYVMFVFGTVFQWFIVVPAVLKLVYNFTSGEIGLAFFSPLVGAFAAVLIVGAIEQWTFPRAVKKSGSRTMVDIEYRLVPAMVGGVLMTASLFWIGWTAVLKISWASPVVGNGVFVCGNMMILISYVSYIFDAFPPPGTLAALTVGASLRLVAAAAVPLFIIQMIQRIGGGWTYSFWGFLSAALMPLTFTLYRFGPNWRMKSKYSARNTIVLNGTEEVLEPKDNSSSSIGQTGTMA